MKDAWNVVPVELYVMSSIMLNGRTQGVDLGSAIAGVNFLFYRNFPGKAV